MSKSSRVVALVTLGLFVAAAPACVLPDQVTKLQRDMSDVQERLMGIQRDQAEQRDKLSLIEAELSGGAGIERNEFADIRLQLEEIVRNTAILEERVNDANARSDRMSQDVQEIRELARRWSTTGGAAPTEPPIGYQEDPGDRFATRSSAGSRALPSPESLYNVAYADFSKGNYALAISGFEEYVSRFPESDLADNALYWVGECHFSQGNFEDAVAAFDRLLSNYPKSDRAPASHLKKGLAYLEQNQIGTAIVQLRFVLEEYPASDESRIARDKLASLGAPVR